MNNTTKENPMDEQTRRYEATRKVERQIAEATIRLSKDPARVAAAKEHLARLDSK
jgi:hypothetical protein